MLNKFKNVLYGAGSVDDNNSEPENGDLGEPMFATRIRNVIKRSTSFQEILSKAQVEIDGNNDLNYSRKSKYDNRSKDDSRLSMRNRRDPRTSYCNSELFKDSKFHYSRPTFLQLKTEDEILVSADHQIRPIIVPRDSSKLPWKSGYAECINAGKSTRNEDQAASYQDVIVKSYTNRDYFSFADSNQNGIDNQIPWYYFGLFDGHAGSAVAVAASMQLHNILAEKLNQLSGLLLDLDSYHNNNSLPDHVDDCLDTFLESEKLKEKTSNNSIETKKKLDSNVNNLDNGDKLNLRQQKSHNKSLETIFESSSEPTDNTPEESKQKDEELSDVEKNASQSLTNEFFPDNGKNESKQQSDKTESKHIPICDPLPNNCHNINKVKLSSSNHMMEAPQTNIIELLCNNVTIDNLIVGALESSFWEMDQLIADDKIKYKMAGGCTAIVSLFIFGKLYVCNAGDSRAIVYKNNQVIPMSFDFTPISEKKRVLRLGLERPEFLGTDFTHLEFLKRPTRRDLGKQMLYKDAYMTGWSMKTITYDDLKFPLVWGEGKRSRVLATIGVTRGFGDHELKAQYGSVSIKPFLTPEPEVKILSFIEDNATVGATDNNTDKNDKLSSEDVLIMATDGLWDVTSNEEAAKIVRNSFDLFPDKSEESRVKYRYITAAQDLVIHSRGQTTNWNNIWRTNNDKLASLDDISVFVIPLKQYRDEYIRWREQRNEVIKLKRAITRQQEEAEASADEAEEDLE